MAYLGIPTQISMNITQIHTAKGPYQHAPVQLLFTYGKYLQTQNGAGRIQIKKQIQEKKSYLPASAKGE